MNGHCIICGEICKEKICVGTKNGMQAVFCDEHSEYCDGCEIMKCIILIN